MPNCCYLCKGDYDEEMPMFSVPNGEDLRRKWSGACNITFSSSAHVCANHFEEKEILGSKKRRLGPFAVPSKQLPSNQNICENETKSRNQLPMEKKENDILLVEINDAYDHPDSKLDYVLENVLSTTYDDLEFKSLQAQYNSILLNPCCCSKQNDCSDCFHGGNYEPCSSTSELVLRRRVSGQKKTDLIYECSSLCQCDSRKCRNRLVQYGPRKHLRVIDSEIYKSKGLVTIRDIPEGAFICEYAGELLTSSEAYRRSTENTNNRKSNYILWLNEHEIGLDDSKRQVTIIDPSQKGNIGRYLNHSCDPNCAMYSIRVDCPVPKIAIFAKRDIYAGEELCFHYAGDTRTSQDERDRGDMKIYTPCLCNANNCEKYLPNLEFR